MRGWGDDTVRAVVRGGGRINLGPQKVTTGQSGSGPDRIRLDRHPRQTFPLSADAPQHDAIMPASWPGSAPRADSGACRSLWSEQVGTLENPL